MAYKSKVLLHKTPRPELLSEVTFGQDRLLSSQIRLPGSGTQVEERTSQGKRWKTRASSVAECWKAAKFCSYQYLSQFQYFELWCAMLAGLRANVATLANLQKRVRIASDESDKVRSKKVELQKWICVISKSSWGPLLATAAIKYYSFCNSNFLTAPHPRNCTNYRSYRSAFALLG